MKSGYGKLMKSDEEERREIAAKAGKGLKKDSDTGTPDHFTAAQRRKRGLPEEVEQIDEAKEPEWKRDKYGARNPKFCNMTEFED
jgi:hypothetical protein